MADRIDIRVDDEGYGVMLYGGMKLVVMPFHRTPVNELARVTEGEMSTLTPSEKPLIVTEADIQEGLRRYRAGKRSPGQQASSS